MHCQNRDRSEVFAVVVDRINIGIGRAEQWIDVLHDSHYIVGHTVDDHLTSRHFILAKELAGESLRQYRFLAVDLYSAFSNGRPSMKVKS